MSVKLIRLIHRVLINKVFTEQSFYIENIFNLLDVFIHRGGEAPLCEGMKEWEGVNA